MWSAGFDRQRGALGRRRSTSASAAAKSPSCDDRPDELVALVVDQRELDREAVLLADRERGAHRVEERLHLAGLDLVASQLHRSHAVDATEHEGFGGKVAVVTGAGRASGARWSNVHRRRHAGRARRRRAGAGRADDRRAARPRGATSSASSPTSRRSNRSRRCATRRSTRSARCTSCATTRVSGRGPRVRSGSTTSTTGAGRSTST